MNQKGFAPIVIILILAIVFTLGVSGYYLETKSQSTVLHQPPVTQIANVLHSPKPSPAQDKNNNDFFFFSIPKPTKDLSIYQLPNDMHPRNVIQYQESLWFAGDGSLVEYDTKSGNIKSYSDYTKANCDSNVVLSNNFLFTSCHTDNIQDALGYTEKLEGKIYAGHYSIFEINPQTHQVEHIFTDKEGLKNRYNYTLVADDNTVWVQTFNGIGKIDATTNKVSFFNAPEIDLSFGIGQILPNKDFVWAYTVDQGLTLFNKTTQSWKQFTSSEVIGRPNYHRLDTVPFDNPIKLIPGGLQIGLWAGDQAQNNCIVRNYDYVTKQWTTASSQQIRYLTQCESLLKSQFPKEAVYTKFDSNGLTQIQLPGSSITYQIDGRDNYILSPMIVGKRYLLTSATIDTIDDKTPFRQILIKLGSRLEENVLYTDLSAYQGLVYFLIDSDGSLALVIDSACGGQGCTGDQKAWFVNLKSGKIIKTYTNSDGLPNGDTLTDLNMSREGDLLLIKNKQGDPVFSINVKNSNLSVLKK